MVQTAIINNKQRHKDALNFSVRLFINFQIFWRKITPSSVVRHTCKPANREVACFSPDGDDDDERQQENQDDRDADRSDDPQQVDADTVEIRLDHLAGTQSRHRRLWRR